jgi:hypothetical protein
MGRPVLESRKPSEEGYEGYEGDGYDGNCEGLRERHFGSEA